MCRPRIQLRQARCACSAKGATAAFPSFLPQHLCAEFEDPDCIALLQSYKQVDVEIGRETISTGFLGPCLQGQQPTDSALPPVLLLHGFDSNVLEWRRVFGKLASIAPTYAVDILGYVSSLPLLRLSPGTPMYVNIRSSCWQVLRMTVHCLRSLQHSHKTANACAIAGHSVSFQNQSE